MFNRWHHLKVLARVVFVLAVLTFAFLGTQQDDIDDFVDSIKINEIPATINPDEPDVMETTTEDPLATWLVTQHWRRRTLADNCPTRDAISLEDVLSGDRESVYGFLDLTIVDQEHKLLFCYVPRVASTNWRRVMMVLTGQVAADMDAILKRDPRDMGQFQTLRSYSAEQRLHLVRNYSKFLFTRHPYRRLDAVYYDRLRYDPAIQDNFQKVVGTDIIRRYRPARYTRPESLKLGHDVRFSELVQFLTDATNADRTSNVHFAPVSSLCHPCLVNYTFIGKVESISEDAPMILRQVANVTLPFRFPPPDQLSKTMDRLAMDMRLLTDEQRSALFKEYEQDFRLFGYDQDDWRDVQT